MAVGWLLGFLLFQHWRKNILKLLENKNRQNRTRKRQAADDKRLIYEYYPTATSENTYIVVIVAADECNDTHTLVWVSKLVCLDKLTKSCSNAKSTEDFAP